MHTAQARPLQGGQLLVSPGQVPSPRTSSAASEHSAQGGRESSHPGLGRETSAEDAVTQTPSPSAGRTPRASGDGFRAPIHTSKSSDAQVFA